MQVFFHSFIKNNLMEAKARLFILSLFALASTGLSQHQHGVGELSMVTEGSRLEIELNIPGGDLLGFEHAAENKSDSNKISSVQKFLNQTESWLELPSKSKCKSIKTKVMYQQEHLQEDSKEEHEHHNHHHDHDHEHHKEKKPDNKVKSEGHFEFKGTFSFTCQEPKHLKAIQVNIFKSYPSLHKINYSAVGKKQTQGSIHKSNNAITNF